jgi:hypothetical protein
MIGLEPGPSSSSFSLSLSSLYLYLFESGLSATASDCGVGEGGGGETAGEPGSDAPFTVALAGDEDGEGGDDAIGGESRPLGNFVVNIFSDFCNNNTFESVTEFSNKSVFSFIS